MISEIVDADGVLYGEVVCGNSDCGQILYSYIGTENSPSLERASFLLVPVARRLFFTDSQGNLLTSNRWIDIQPNRVDVILQLDGSAVGYQIIQGKQVQLEDFCSNSCASKFLRDNPEWALCLRNEADNSVKFVSQHEDRFMTEVVPIPLRPLLDEEMKEASQAVQSYRPTKPFSLLEQALGLLAFTNWLALGLQRQEECYFEAANASAREVAILYAENILSQPQMRVPIQARIPTFNLEQELIWAKAKANNGQWQMSLTRAIILLCRSLAYRYTGDPAPYSWVLHEYYPFEIEEIAFEMYTIALRRA